MQTLANVRHFPDFWTMESLPDIGDGSDPEKNISLLHWFLRRYQYTEADAAQLLGVSKRSVYRWLAKNGLPKRTAVTLLGLCGARQAQLGRWRQR